MGENGKKLQILQIGVDSLPLDTRRWNGARLTRVDVSIDRDPDWPEDPRRLPGDLGTYDVVFTSHVLQWVPRTEIIQTLKHWVTFLKPGGEMHVIVPDLSWAADEIAANRSVDKLVLGVIFGTQHNTWAFHRTGFTTDLLRTALFAAGLETRACRLGPYKITSVGGDGQVRELVARQIYAVAVKPHQEEDGNARDEE